MTKQKFHVLSKRLNKAISGTRKNSAKNVKLLKFCKLDYIAWLGIECDTEVLA